jgi:hypothetical protein
MASGLWLGGVARADVECPATAFESSNLFFPPKGMTLMTDVIDLFKQDTPPGFFTLAWRDSFWRSARVAAIMLGAGPEAQATLFEDEWGLIVDCERIRGLTYRAVEEPAGSNHPPSKVGVISCALCHTGRVAGRVWEGLGNKRVDIFMLGRDGYGLQGWLDSARRLRPGRGAMARAIDENSVAFTKRMSDDDVTNRTVGLVADAHVAWWIYDVTGPPQPPKAPRGEMKVPALWNFAERRGKCSLLECEVGIFADAFGTGRGWLGGAVLAASQDLGVVGSEPYQAEVDRVEQAVRGLPGPPPYPCPVDPVLAATGERVFRKHRCGECHRTEPGPPRVVRADWVRTDPDRLRILGAPPGHDGAFGAETRRRLDRIGAQVPRLTRARFVGLDPDGTVAHGYVAPRLEGVWARFPYLHNGSVPTLYELLSPPEERRQQFDLTLVDTRACFDPVRVGLRDAPACRPNLERWSKPADPETFETDPGLRNVYDTRRTGHRNVGHDFWRDLKTGEWTLDEPAKAALIEYVKTLGGTKQDADWCPE